jgi:hypothetical protein
MSLLTDVEQGDVVELSLTNGDRDAVGVIEIQKSKGENVAVEGYIIALEPAGDPNGNEVFVPKDDIHVRISAKRVTFLIDEVVKVRHFGGLSGFASYDLSPDLPRDVEDAVSELIGE